MILGIGMGKVKRKYSVLQLVFGCITTIASCVGFLLSCDGWCLMISENICHLNLYFYLSLTDLLPFLLFR